MACHFRQGFLIIVALAFLILQWLPPEASVHTCSVEWPDYEDFQQRFIDVTGKVVDHDHPLKHTTSEGQAYALFFSLIANDRPQFDQILAWTHQHLTTRGLDDELPAWEWAIGADGTGRILDENSASDADLWLSFTLMEAGRIWHDDGLKKTGQRLASHILDSESADIPGLGLTVLPGRWGFTDGTASWRINPSYYPAPLLTYLALYADDPRWHRVLASSRKIVAATNHGFASDWLVYQSPQGLLTDPVSKGDGSYDAIRVYLWAGLTPAADPTRKDLLISLEGMSLWLSEHPLPPEHVNPQTGQIKGDGPPGFSAALLPYLMAKNDQSALRSQIERLSNAEQSQKEGYFGSALMLFGRGFAEERYRFRMDGRLDTPWIAGCDT